MVKVSHTQLQQTSVTRRGRSVGREERGKRERNWEGGERCEKMRRERSEKGAAGEAALELLLLLDFSDSPRTGLQEYFDPFLASQDALEVMFVSE